MTAPIALAIVGMLVTNYSAGAAAGSSDVPVIDKSMPSPPREGQGTSSLHALPSVKQSAGVSVRLEELSREPARKGTRVSYAIRTSGFPQGKTFRVLNSSLSSNWKGSIVLEGVGVNARGELTGGTVPIETLIVRIEEYNYGESFRLEVVADDDSIYAADTVFPFPLVARDGQCQLWAELVTKNRKNYALWGSGFQPGDTVRIESTDGYDPVTSTQTIDDSGVFMVPVIHGKSGGTAVFSVAGQHCTVTLSYPFGRKAKGPQ